MKTGVPGKPGAFFQQILYGCCMYSIEQININSTLVSLFRNGLQPALSTGLSLELNSWFLKIISTSPFRHVRISF